MINLSIFAALSPKIVAREVSLSALIPRALRALRVAPR